MLREPPSFRRELRSVALASDLVVVGGGLSGLCCAITAARSGLRVTLIHDRPVLGGNGSSEVRLWILGATSHLGNNNRWAREGGVIDEILVENLFRNREGNPLILDTLLLEKVIAESNITLLLNTAVYDLEKSDAETIRSVRAFCSQNSTAYEVSAPLFVDASGDGVVGFLAGAAFRMGAEARAEFGEKLAPAESSHKLLGHTIYFYSKDTGQPVKFVPPSFALTDMTQIPRFRDFTARDSGCRLWWLEWGGELDTIHESETIKWELWKVAYGVWNHIKNSGRFPEAETLTLEWVGTIPGKRESRRFEGDHLLCQQDIVEQREHPDAVSFGGWAIDLHPPKGVFSSEPGCTQWHAKGVYQIPYRCFYSRNLANLFLAGRIISATHIAFGSTRVMATCAHGGQAVGAAAAICHREKLQPRELLARIPELQRDLLRLGQFIPGVTLQDPEDLARSAQLSASSELRLRELRADGTILPLSQPWAMMLPVEAGRLPKITLTLDVAAATELHVELRLSHRPENHTPEVTLASRKLSLAPGRAQRVELDFKAEMDEPRYAFVCLLTNEEVSVHLSDQRVTGLLALTHAANKSVTKSATQKAPANSGIDTFEFWTPQRRPGGKNFALTLEPPLAAFPSRHLTNGIARPTRQTNAWAASRKDSSPSLTLTWPSPQVIGRVELILDTDFDHPLESVLMGHPEEVMPFCVSQGQLCDRAGQVLASFAANHQSRLTLSISPPVTTDFLTLRLTPPNGGVPAALFEIRCYPQ